MNWKFTFANFQFIFPVKNGRKFSLLCRHHPCRINVSLLRTPVYKMPNLQATFCNVPNGLKESLELQRVHGKDTYNEIMFKGRAATCTQELILSEFTNRESATDEEWEQLMKDIVLFKLGAINDRTVPVKIIEHCSFQNNLNLMKCFLEYMKRKGITINYGMQCMILKMYFSCRLQCTEEDRKYVLNMSQRMLNKVPIITPAVGEALIMGFSITAEWEKCFEIVEKIKQLDTPTKAVRYAIALALLRNDKVDRFWQYITDVYKEDLTISSYLFASFLDKYSGNFEVVNKMLHFFSEFDVKPTKSIVLKIKEELSNYPQKHRLIGSFTSVSVRGKCHNCKKTLNPLILKDHDFNRLRDEFLNRVMVGKDVFNSSTPEELQRFKKFIEKQAPYDLVIDGLNVAFMVSRNVKTSRNYYRCQMLKEVVKHFSTVEPKRMLIIGKQHMDKWNKRDMEFIKKHAEIFFTHDL